MRTITSLLHRAYAPLAARGMRYLASHQDESVTRERLTAEGSEGFVAEFGGRIVGTVTLCSPRDGAAVHWYRLPGVFTFEQFAVDPDYQGQGIGALLIGRVENRAVELGAIEIACDTSEHATELIATYTRRGYREVARTEWEVTNYVSVVLSRSLGGTRHAGHP
ncbi:MAG: GNAT family N-acetyltransferase [Planctomycetota bacterium]